MIYSSQVLYFFSPENNITLDKLIKAPFSRDIFPHQFFNNFHMVVWVLHLKGSEVYQGTIRPSTDPSDLHRGHRSTFHVKFDDFSTNFRGKSPML